jgi:hypothetical protein
VLLLLRLKILLEFRGIDRVLVGIWCHPVLAHVGNRWLGIVHVLRNVQEGSPTLTITLPSAEILN